MADNQNPEQDHQGSGNPPLPAAANESGGAFKSAEDSLALTRAKGAYQQQGGKKYTQSLKEKKTPQRVIAANLNPVDPYTEDDIDDDTLIAPSKNIIGSAYIGTAKKDNQPQFKAVAESTGGDDILSLQSNDSRNVQTVSFKVKGIQWRAGFAAELTNTPLGHAIHPTPLPNYKDEIPESLKKAGIVLRPVNPRLRVVLNQLLPPDFRKKVSQQRKKTDRLKLLAIFYLPGTPSAHVGFIHEFIGSKSNYKFYLYIQTSVGKAPVAILDEVLKTLEAGLPEGEKATDLEEYEVAEEDDDLPEVDFDLANEVGSAMKQAGDSFNNSIMVYGAKQANRIVKDWSLELIRLVDKGVARVIRMMTWAVIMLANSPIIRAIAAVTQFFSKAIVHTIWGVNKLLLGIVRSPITRAIIENFVRVFKVAGRLFLLGWLGIKWVFMTAVAITAYFFNFVKDPRNTTFNAVSIEFPGFGKGMFNEDGSTKERKSKANKKALPQVKKTALSASKNKVSANKKLPPPKPLQKPGKKPGALTPGGAPPALPGKKEGGISLGSGAGGIPGAPQSKAPGGGKGRELGYFEDQAF